jgi:hypothetical protein
MGSSFPNGATQSASMIFQAQLEVALHLNTIEKVLFQSTNPV